MRYFIGFLITIGLIILLIVLLFRGNSAPKTPLTTKSLSSYSTSDAEVRLSIDGPVNADQTHQQIRITVGQNDATYEQLQGYDGSVVKSQTYASSQNAYYVFLRALGLAGFNLTTSSTITDERGYCPLGERFVFELMQDGKDLKRSWATSCGTPKTYGGNVPLTLSLFRAQIPDYAKLSQNVIL